MTLIGWHVQWMSERIEKENQKAKSKYKDLNYIITYY